MHGRANHQNPSVLLSLTSSREQRSLFLTLMQIGTGFFAFTLQLGWERGFVGNADLRSLHKLTSTNPKGQVSIGRILTDFSLLPNRACDFHRTRLSPSVTDYLIKDNNTLWNYEF